MSIPDPQVKLHGDGTLEVWVELPVPDFEIKRVLVLETGRAGCGWYYPETALLNKQAEIERQARICAEQQIEINRLRSETP